MVVEGEGHPEIGPLKFERTIGRAEGTPEADRAEIMTQAIPLIEQHYARLRELERERLGDATPEAAEEALSFYNQVVADGRFVDLLVSSPAEAAERLGLAVSPEALRVMDRVSTIPDIAGPLEGPVEAVIAVAVVIVLAPKIPDVREGVVIEDTARVAIRL